MNLAEKETLEVKNEKMQEILKQRDVEDRLRDLERDFQDKEKQFKFTAANELKDLVAKHQQEIEIETKDLKKKLKFLTLKMIPIE